MDVASQVTCIAALAVRSASWLRDEEARARRVPDGAVAREVIRPLADNTAGIATWLDECEPDRRGDLTRKSSDVPGWSAAPLGSYSLEFHAISKR